MTDLTDDQINDRLDALLPFGDLWIKWESGGYTNPAVVVGLMERFKIDIGWDEECVASWATGFGNDIPAYTLAEAVALAAIRYLEQSHAASDT